MTHRTLKAVLSEGEGQRIEFKESTAHLDREMVAFANASGGSIFIGIDDAGKISGIPRSNELTSRVQDIARNCDPSVKAGLRYHGDRVLEVVVDEGVDKPYRCKSGFYLRTGPNTQKLTRNEIRSIIRAKTVHFDERWNEDFRYPDDFDGERFNRFLEECQIAVNLKPESLLQSLDVAEEWGGRLRFNNAGALFFSGNPQRFLKESYATCIRYRGADRFEIVDRQDIFGNPVECIRNAMAFIQRNIRMQEIVGEHLQHRSVYEYPLPALREAVINAVTHRDYFYDLSHIYVHIFADRLEIENPGGLPPGLSIEELGVRSVRRNRLVADLLYRAGYIERIGSGIQRMKRALAENNNPDLEVVATNFFVIRFFPRLPGSLETKLSSRARMIVRMIGERGQVSKQDVARFLDVGNDTALRELNGLCAQGVIRRIGTGRGTKYGAN